MSANTSISPLIAQFNMQTRLFHNVLENFDKNYDKRPGEKTNHAAWLAGHIAGTRINIANMIGVDYKNPYSDLYENFKPLDPASKYPSLEDVKKTWNEVSPKFSERLNQLDDKFLSAPAPFKLPIEDGTMKGVLAFFSHHEAYHLGQLGTTRRYFGYDGMKY